MIKPIQIKNTKISGNVFLAPLAGVSDVGFRKVCRVMGANLSYTEMVSAKGLLYKNKNTARLLITEPEETPCAVQIFGSELDVMAEACKNPMLAKFDIIDINMGCPVPKVVGSGEGCALMLNIHTAEKIIKSCVKSTDKPITVKFRKGFDKDNINAVEFARMCEGAGASLITVHGRLQTQFYSGKSDRGIIGEVVKAVGIPVIANGDIYSRIDAFSLIEETGAAGVMVARGALGNPQIFSEISEETPCLSLYEAVNLHYETLCRHMGEKFTVLNMRKHLLWYLDNVTGGKALKKQAAKCNSMEELRAFSREAFYGKSAKSKSEGKNT